ncbi:MAG TPA: S4 domain-containing protein YaaA [Clostridiaceae bacterium]|nr:S4 domain-containing protein YaaA [Clostridiaceae bacterium]
MKEITITTEYIKLDQLLKLSRLVNSGGEAKDFIACNDIYVNDEKEIRRGRKLRDGDIVRIGNQVFRIVQNGEQK